MKKTLLISTILLTVTACSTTKPMPDSQYSSMGLHSAGLTACFNAGRLSPEFYVKGKRSLDTALTAWEYDSKKLKAESERQQKTFKPTIANCRNVEADFISAEMTIKDAQMKVENTRKAIQNLNSSIERNKPVYCNQYGTTTVCK